MVTSGFFLAAMMPLKDGYRGSLIFSMTPTTTGSLPRTVAYPLSVCRSIVTVPPPGSAVTLRASVS